MTCRGCSGHGYVKIERGPRAGDCRPCPECSPEDAERDEGRLEDSDAYVDRVIDRDEEERSTVFAGRSDDDRR